MVAPTYTNADFHRILGSVPTRTDVATDITSIHTIQTELGSSGNANPTTHQDKLREYARALGISASWIPGQEPVPPV